MFDKLLDKNKEMVEELQKNQFKAAAGRVNFVIKRKMPDETELTANSINPELLIKAFWEFLRFYEKTKPKNAPK